jgi:hypothetical protein
VAQALAGAAGHLLPIGSEKVKGISSEIPIFEYRDSGTVKTSLRSRWLSRPRRNAQPAA